MDLGRGTLSPERSACLVSYDEISAPRLSNELGLPAVAMTDHGNMFGAVEFYKAAKKAGVKPILGCEVAIKSLDPDATSDSRNYSLVLLARTDEGYLNLIKLVSNAWRCRQDRLSTTVRYEALVRRSAPRER